MDKLTEEELNEIESQLSFPEGCKGLEMARLMNDTNTNMTLATIEALAITDHHTVVELGHGNCAHLPHIIQRGADIHYCGLEISPTMQQEASRLHGELATPANARFLLYDGIHIPLPNLSADRVMTVNTVYFWNDPQGLLSEIHRILKPGGKLAITFAQKKFMQHLPFVRDKFTLYDTDAITGLLHRTAFAPCQIINKQETVKSKSGESVMRHYSIALAEKEA